MSKVLVVDDSVSVRKVIERALEARKIQVISAARGVEALERIEREAPDLIVSDVVLPDKDGFQICEFVKTHPRLSETPVLLISGIVNEAVLDRAARVQSNDVMRKPFAAEELARKVDDLLAMRGTVSSAVARPRPIEHTDAKQDGRVDAQTVSAPVAATILAPASPEPAAAPVAAHVVAIEDLHPSPAALGQDLHAQLAQFAAISGVGLAVVADREGFLIESVGEMGLEADVVGALASCLAESSDGLGRELHRGSLQGMILEYETGMVLIHGLGAKALLAVALTDPAALGKVRYYARKALPELARAL